MADKQISDLTAATGMTDGSLFVIEQSGSAKSANWGMIKGYISPDLAPLYSNNSTYSVGDYVIYNGSLYRCVVQISSAEAWTAAHWTETVLGDDVGDLKIAIDNFQQLKLVASSAGGSSTWTLGKYRSLTNHTLTSEPSAAYSGSLNTAQRKAVTMTNSAYLFAVNCYSSTPVSSATLIKGYGWYSSETIIAIPANTAAIITQVKRVDGATIDGSETNAIKAAFSFFVPTDVTLALPNAAADAKVIGDRFETIADDIQTHSSVLPLDKDAFAQLNNYYMTTADGTVTSTSTTTQMLYFKCSKNVIYTVAHPLSTRFIIGCFTSVPVANSVPTKYKIGTSADTSEDVTTFLTDDSAEYLAFYYYTAANNTETLENTYNALSVTSTPFDTTLSESGVAPDSAVVGQEVRGNRNFYSVEDSVTLATDSADVYSLFDALCVARPDYVTKNTLTSGTFENYEYVLTIGNYNTSGQRSRDSQIAKPKILITSGVHGYERSAVMSLYTFVKSLCDNEYSLDSIIYDFEYHIIPVVCPWGYTNDSRINANGVNINRNFATSDWTPTSQGSDYSGAAAGDQDETKVVQNWLNLNNDAVLYLDWHNSNFTSEISCMLGDTTTEAMAFKKAYLVGENKVIPYWQKNRGLTTANIYAYCGNSATPGTAKGYGIEAGIQSFTFETSWNVISSGKHSNFSIGTGAEAFGNLLVAEKNLLL